MRRSVAEATIYEYGRMRHREDISWVLTQNSSFKLTIHKLNIEWINECINIGIMGGGRAQWLGQHSPYVHAYT